MGYVFGLFPKSAKSIGVKQDKIAENLRLSVIRNNQELIVPVQFWIYAKLMLKERGKFGI